MKESYIYNKVADIFGHKRSKGPVAERMERERQAARVTNLAALELEVSLEKLKQHYTKYLHTLIKEQLK